MKTDRKTLTKFALLATIIIAIGVLGFNAVSNYNYTFTDGTNTNTITGDGVVQTNTQGGTNLYYVFQHDGVIIQQGEVHNLVTNSGLDWLVNQIFITSGSANASEKAVYIYLSTNTTSPAATWTWIDTEITGNGLDRAIGTVTHNSNANHTVAKTFTATGTQSGIASAGLAYTVTASCKYDLFAVAQLSPTVNMGSGDTLTITWVNTAA